MTPSALTLPQRSASSGSSTSRRSDTDGQLRRQRLELSTPPAGRSRASQALEEERPVGDRGHGVGVEHATVLGSSARSPRLEGRRLAGRRPGARRPGRAAAPPSAARCRDRAQERARRASARVRAELGQARRAVDGRRGPRRAGSRHRRGTRMPRAVPRSTVPADAVKRDGTLMTAPLPNRAHGVARRLAINSGSHGRPADARAMVGAMRIVLLAGGTGGAKLARGLRDLCDLTVVANTGDDVEIHGAWVSPDPDLVLFWLADRIDARGWGLDGDTFHAMDRLRARGEDVWFNLGDEDLEIGRDRLRRLRAGERLTETLDALRATLGVPTRVLPMCDEPAPTFVGGVPFQEWMIRPGRAARRGPAGRRDDHPGGRGGDRGRRRGRDRPVATPSSRSTRSSRSTGVREALGGEARRRREPVRRTARSSRARPPRSCPRTRTSSPTTAISWTAWITDLWLGDADARRARRGGGARLRERLAAHERPQRQDDVHLRGQPRHRPRHRQAGRPGRRQRLPRRQDGRAAPQARGHHLHGRRGDRGGGRQGAADRRRRPRRGLRARRRRQVRRAVRRHRHLRQQRLRDQPGRDGAARDEALRPDAGHQHARHVPVLEVVHPAPQEVRQRARPDAVAAAEHGAEVVRRRTSATRSPSSA